MTSPSNAPALADPGACLAYMRRLLQPNWVGMEAGGIFLMNGVDDQAYLRFLDGFLQLPEGAEGSHDELSDVAEQLSQYASRFFERAQLAPGAYELQNHHLEYADGLEIVMSADDDPPIMAPAESVFTFEVTPEHLKLMRRLNTRAWDCYIEAMDPKRPYGDMSFYFLDMAEALGEQIPRDKRGRVKLPKEQQQRYVELHGQMLFAVQAFWSYGDAAPNGVSIFA